MSKPKLALLVSVLLVMVPVASFGQSVTPPSVQAWFDLGFIPLMWMLGAVWSKWPALRNIPNAAIPWVNVAAYMLARIAAPAEAHAGFFGDVFRTMSPLALTLKGAVTSAVASVLWDKFLSSPVGKYIPNAAPTKR